MTQDQIVQLTMADLWQQWPQTAVLFQRYQMACLGCVMSPFCVVADVITIYKLDKESFLHDLMQVIESNSEETTQAAAPHDE